MPATEAFRAAIAAGDLRVDSDGQIWRLTSKWNGNRVIRATPVRAEKRMKSGYLAVHLWWEGIQYLVWAHRLVWTLLYGEIPPTMDINHIDGNKANNHPRNLELATRSENLLHALRTGLRKTTDVPRDIAPRAKELHRMGLSFHQIAERLGVSQTTAFRAVRNR